MAATTPCIFETERLRLRKFTFDDTKFIIELLNSPGWIEFIGDRNVKTEDQAAAYLQNGPMKSYVQNGFGLSMVETKAGHPIGMCGILKRDTLDNPDIGFAFFYTSWVSHFGNRVIGNYRRVVIKINSGIVGYRIA